MEIKKEDEEQIVKIVLLRLPLSIKIQQLHPFSATVPLQENREQRQFEIGQMTSFLRAKEEGTEV